MRIGLFSIAILSLTQFSAAQEKNVILRVNSDGPRTTVSEMVFCDKGQRLLIAGWDKTVQTWQVPNNEKPDDFKLDENGTYRIPIGPAQTGVINSIAVSDDDRWLAIAGKSLIRRESGFRDAGRIYPIKQALSEDMKEDRGVIHLVNRVDGKRKYLRGHKFPVNKIAFAKDSQNRDVLFSLAAEEADANETEYTVCMWDLAMGSLTKSISFRQKASLTVPVIAVIGNKSSALTLGISVNALNISKLKLWHVTSNVVEEVESGLFTTCLSALRDKPEFASGAGGSLKHWRQNGNSFTKVKEWSLPKFANLLWLPQSCSLIPSDAGDKLAVGAVGLVPGKGASQARLLVYDWPIVDVASPLQNVKLWDIRTTTPQVVSVLASPDGKRVAVSGSPNHRVQTYAVADLLNKIDAPKNIVSRFRTIQEVSFGTSENRPQLLIRTLGSDKWNLSLNLEDQSFGAADEDSEQNRVKTKFVTATGPTPLQGDKVRYTIPINGTSTSEIEILAKQTVTNIAVAPDASMFVVATHINGQDPRLTVFDVKSGDAIREFKGHTERIESLAFSADGRRLASSARDRKICIWDLTTVDEILGMHGTLKNVVIDSDRFVTERTGDADASLLQVGDQLMRRTGDDADWDSSLELFHSIWEAKPGENVNVTVMRNGNQIQLPVQTSQASDERKPLCSLLITNDNRGKPRWIAWSPMGPFETSTNDLMKTIGWHFNSDDPSDPVAFADVGEYRDLYFRSNLLKSLFSKGIVPPLPRLQRPTMSMQLLRDEFKELDLPSDRALRTFPRTVLLTMAGYFPIDQLESVQFELDGKPINAVSNASSWEADLPEADLTRGEHRLRAIVKTKEYKPQEFSEELSFEFQPPAAVVKFGNIPAQTRDQSFQFTATVSPVIKTEELDVALRYGENVKRWGGNANAPLNFQIPLQEGDNQLIFAVNPKGQKAGPLMVAEYFNVVRIVDPTPPPVITLNEVEYQTLEEVVTTPIKWKQATSVAGSACTVLGTIVSSKENLSSIEATLNGERIQLASAGSIGKAQKIDFRESLRLRGGTNLLKISAQSGNSKVVAVEHTINFLPPIPEISIDYPKDNLVISEFLPEAKSAFQVSADNPFPNTKFTVQLNANGKLLGAHDNKVLVEDMVPLNYGDNTFVATITNPWRPKQKRKESVKIQYLPNPIVSKIETSVSPGKPTFSVNATVRSAFPVERVSIEGVDIQGIEIGDRVSETSQLSVPAIDFIAGRKTIGLTVHCGNTESNFDVPVPAIPLPPKPEIQFTKPSQAVMDDKYLLRFVVSSESELQTLQVKNGDKIILDDPSIQFPAELAIPLDTGMQTIKITATNSGGMSAEHIQINRIPSPATISIDSVSATKTGEGIPVITENGSQSLSKPINSNEAWISGRVNWGELPTAKRKIITFVNGYQQIPFSVPLPDREKTSEFKIPIFLSDESNEVRVELPDVGTAKDLRAKVRILCSQKRRPKTLRLYMFDIGSSDKKELDASKKSLGITRDRKHPMFESVVIKKQAIQAKAYLDFGEIKSLLRKIASEQDTSAKAQDGERTKQIQRHPPNEVIVIYIHGETVEKDGQNYLIEAPGRKRSDAFVIDEIQRSLQSVAGAKFLLTDFRSVAESNTKYSLHKPIGPPSEPASSALGYLSVNVIANDAKQLLSAIEKTRNAKPTNVNDLKEGLEDFAKQKGGLQFDNQFPFPVDLSL